MPFSQYAEQAILNEIFGATDYTPPANLYLGLSAAIAAGATQASILAGEPSSTGSYARVAVPNNTTNWPNASGSAPAVQSLAVIETFPASSAAWSSGASLLNSLFIADAATLAGGNVLCWGAILVPFAVNASGITPALPLSALQIQLT